MTSLNVTLGLCALTSPVTSWHTWRRVGVLTHLANQVSQRLLPDASRREHARHISSCCCRFRRGVGLCRNIQLVQIRNSFRWIFIDSCEGDLTISKSCTSMCKLSHIGVFHQSNVPFDPFSSSVISVPLSRNAPSLLSTGWGLNSEQ